LAILPELFLRKFPFQESLAESMKKYEKARRAEPEKAHYDVTN